MSNDSSEVLIIGGGAAGLAAAIELARSGLRPIIVEARERLGGRILTIKNASTPIELGAEFLHGLPPDVWQMIGAAKLRTCLVSGSHWFLQGETLVNQDEFFQSVEQVFKAMKEACRQVDLSFNEFADQYQAAGDENRLKQIEVARRYVEGFNAARGADVSVRWLLQEEDASDTIHGDRQLRFIDGYTGLIDWMESQLADLGAVVHTGTEVKAVSWRRGKVDLGVIGPHRDAHALSAAGCLITLPLAVLTAPENEPGGVHFEPALTHKRDALKLLRPGQAQRVVLIFRRAFWQKTEFKQGSGSVDLFDMGFLHAPGQIFPTWWTQNPMQLPLLTGWAAGPAADGLAGKTEGEMQRLALRSLSQIFRISDADLRQELLSLHTHDWQKDPYSRCAYSYTAKNGMGAAKVLAEPIEDTLFFAGEATDSDGFSGTVHGAIRSGIRAAKEIKQALKV